MKKIYFLIVFIFIQGCNSGPEYTVADYTFIDYYSSMPLKNFKVNITKMEITHDMLTKPGVTLDMAYHPGQLPGPHFIVDSILTDSTGKAHYVHEVDSKNASYFSPNQNSSYSQFEDEELSNGGTDTKTLKVKPWKKLVLNLKNASNKYHSINVTFNTLKLGGSGNYTGKFSDTVITFLHSVPEENIIVNYKLYENSIYADPKLTLDTTFITSQAAQDFITIQK